MCRWCHMHGGGGGGGGGRAGGGGAQGGGGGGGDMHVPLDRGDQKKFIEQGGFSK